MLWMSVCNLGWNVVLSLASNATAYAVDRPESTDTIGTAATEPIERSKQGK